MVAITALSCGKKNHPFHEHVDSHPQDDRDDDSQMMERMLSDTEINNTTKYKRNEEERSQFDATCRRAVFIFLIGVDLNSQGHRNDGLNIMRGPPGP